MAQDSSAQEIPIIGTTYGLFNGALAWFLFGVLLWIVVFPH
ncbi:hypothetical protein [Abditibacterium utsteinense]|nr:hypothetical protein [Abditibacterium utsteinense]